MFPEVAIRVVDAFRRKTQPPPGDVSLTPQEIRLLKLLTEGHQNKTAAAELGISIHTVGFHLRSVYTKLHVHPRSEAVARALREKWLPARAKSYFRFPLPAHLRGLFIPPNKQYLQVAEPEPSHEVIAIAQLAPSTTRSVNI